MAEYKDVIKQFKRMCRYYNNMATQNDCPLYCKGHGCNISHCRMLAFDDKKFQNVVMTWAVEHPEPVYPTWGEWFVEHGDLVDGWQNATNAAWMANTALGVFMKPIPADIAQKLGLKPKEGHIKCCENCACYEEEWEYCLANGNHAPKDGYCDCYREEPKEGV